MNKIHLKWIFKPTWQLFFWQFAIFGITVLAIYLLVLRTEWLEIIAARNEVITGRFTVLQYKQQLLSLPTLAVIQDETTSLSLTQKQLQNSAYTLIQRINQPLSASGGQLLTWQDKENLIVKNTTQRRGHLAIGVTYSGLLHFLQGILLLQPSIQIEHMNIRTEPNGLIVEFELAEYIFGGRDGE